MVLVNLEGGGGVGVLFLSPDSGEHLIELAVHFRIAVVIFWLSMLIPQEVETEPPHQRLANQNQVSPKRIWPKEYTTSSKSIFKNRSVLR